MVGGGQLVFSQRPAAKPAAFALAGYRKLWPADQEQFFDRRNGQPRGAASGAGMVIYRTAQKFC